MRRRAHFTGVRKRKHILKNPNILCTIQFRRSRKTWTSLRLLSPIKQKSNKEKNFPHHPPHPLPHLCFSPPNPPFPSPIILLEPLFFIYTCKENKVEIALHWNRDFSNHFARESKFVSVIGILKIGGKQCLAGEGKLGLLQNMGIFKTPRVRE